MIMSTIVLSLGGSILAPDKLEPDFISSLAALFKRLCNENKLYIVVGGGVLARKYIGIGRDLGGNEINLDELGIASTRLNARLLITALAEFANPKPAKSFSEALILGKSFPIIVMGGTHPGHTTDAVAVMLGEYLNADKFINATSVDGVYTADPAIDSSAVKLDKLTPDQLIEITLKSASQAGPHIVIDPLAARMIKRSGIPTYVLAGRDLEALESAITGKPFSGSIIE
jgi:uridylate kinase